MIHYVRAQIVGHGERPPATHFESLKRRLDREDEPAFH
jgi:hypothetical protein